MKGSINTLRKWRRVCQNNGKDCKGCPLGILCGKITADWSDEDIVNLVALAEKYGGDDAQVRK